MGSSSAIFQGEDKKYLSCHHPVLVSQKRKKLHKFFPQVQLLHLRAVRRRGRDLPPPIWSRLGGGHRRPGVEILGTLPGLWYTLPETNIAMENPTILMVFTRKDGDFHGRAVNYREGTQKYSRWFFSWKTLFFNGWFWGGKYPLFLETPHIPSLVDSSRDLFGMVKTWSLPKVVGDEPNVQGWKRSRLESPGERFFSPYIPSTSKMMWIWAILWVD